MAPRRPGWPAAQEAQNWPVASILGPKRARVVSQGVLAMSEARFRGLLLGALKRRGYVVWYVPDSRRLAAGLPDLLAYHPDRPGRMLAWELKKARGRLRPEQAAALAHLATVPGIDARVARPQDWEDLIQEAER